MSENRRVVITGLGIVSPVGNDVDTFWSNIKSGQSGLGPITGFDASTYSSQIAGEVKDLDLSAYIPRKDQRRMDPFSHYGLVAAQQAIVDSGIDFDQVDRERAGVIIGNGIGGSHMMQLQTQKLMCAGNRKLSPFTIPQMLVNIVAGQIAIEHGLLGPNFVVVSACASAAHSMGEALRMIQHGDADVLVSGGTEATIHELIVGGFDNMKALCGNFNDRPTEGSRPFDKDRCGFVIGEGAGMLILEEYEHAKKRGAKIYCELAGYGRTCDANHITAPDPEGKGAARGIRLAVADAGLTAADIDYVNAHGTSTPLNDKCETRAIKGGLGEDEARRVAISSTKSMTGHLLGAAAGVESVVCALALRDQIAPPTINYTTPDPDCDLDYVPNTARDLPIRACLNNSLGFGGHNATLCFKKE